MTTKNEHLAGIKESLKERIANPAAYVTTVKGKPLKREFLKLAERMIEGDELWEWEWFGTLGARNSYSFGWCVVRTGEVIASHCHSHG